MHFHADLHVHSKYSRATSKNADLEHLALWAAKKGLSVIGTGDFTHPIWLAQLKEKLIPAEPGLFRLHPDLESQIMTRLPSSCRRSVRFLLEVEISTIYKKNDAVRKIHHLIYVPHFDAADRLVNRLGRIGNLNADGRPILGLDSAQLLNILLTITQEAYLIPAHIWTPWFAMLGSRSGFDSVEECYGDMSDHIFALETGLSSDPPMNWHVSALDRYRLVSNSDAHSPHKLAREATSLDTSLDYYAIRHALQTGDGYLGTIEFFPEEGKYHLDGHRKCRLRFSPQQTNSHNGCCPLCGEELTRGVLHRVEVLADRTDARKPPNGGTVTHLVPLCEILSEITSTAPQSQRVTHIYEQLLASFGPELGILNDIPIDTLRRGGFPILAEALTRLRCGQVFREAGYDGEYGQIRLFEVDHLRSLLYGDALFQPSTHPQKKQHESLSKQITPRANDDPEIAAITPIPPQHIDPDQDMIAQITDQPLLVIAGPGSGKTRLLIHWITHLLTAAETSDNHCLAITFTRRAGAEIRQRLSILLPEATASVSVHTFHSLGLSILREHGHYVGLPADFSIADDVACIRLVSDLFDLSERKARTLIAAISKAKRTASIPNKIVTSAVWDRYQRAMTTRHWIDFDDLIILAHDVLMKLPTSLYPCWYGIAVDEFQDIDAAQYRLLRRLISPKTALCAIGDPDQMIYSFRGASVDCFAKFQQDYPHAMVTRLNRNYRSSNTIITAASQLMSNRKMDVVRRMDEQIICHTAATEHAEAEFIVQTIEQLLGGHTFFSLDSNRAESSLWSRFSFADIAILYRTSVLSAPVCRALAHSGIPFHMYDHVPLIQNPVIKVLLKAVAQEPADVDLAGRLRTAAEKLRLDPEKYEVSTWCQDRQETARDLQSEVHLALQQLLVLAESHKGESTRFHDAVTLSSTTDLRDARAEQVSLMTLHAAKGLEFRVVFIVGLEEGILPLVWGGADHDKDDDIEERRLFYVGMTRAQDRLILSRALRRQWRGKVRHHQISRFFSDIEQALLELSRQTYRHDISKRKQLALF